MNLLRIGMRILRSSPTAALVAWIAAAPAAADSERKSYRQGLAALDRGEWSEVARLMGEAIALDGQARVRLAPLARRPYLPHYHLGLARFELGDCNGAVAAWDESLRQQVVQGFEAHQSLIERNESCRRGLILQGEVASLLEQAAGVVDELGSAGDERLASSASEAGTPSFKDRIEGARQSLAAAEIAFGASSANDPEALERSRVAAANTLEILVAIRADISRYRTRQSAIDEDRQRAVEEAREVFDAVRLRLDATAHVRSYSPRADRRWVELETELKSVTASLPQLATAEIEPVALRLSESLARYDRAVRGPPRRIYQVVEAYLEGDHEKTLEASAAISSGDPRVVAHVHLLRAAALFALSQGNRLEGDTLEPVLQEVELARRADPSLKPSPRLFSPRFVELFANAERRETP